MRGKPLEVQKSGSLEVGTFGKAEFAIVCSNGIRLDRSNLQLRNRGEQVGAPALLVTHASDMEAVVLARPAMLVANNPRANLIAEPALIFCTVTGQWIE